MKDINHLILGQIKDTISNFIASGDISTRWKDPLVGFADAHDPVFDLLKEVANENHLKPFDILESASTVIAYFLPFEDFIGQSNIKERTASLEWARAYVETNLLLGQINDDLIKFFTKMGFEAGKLPPDQNMDYERLTSVWSNRHVAYIAGLGKFGINNMLITEKGSCGRYGNIVTNFKIQATKRTANENCLFKHDGSCGICVDNCVNDALFIDNFDRFKCYEMCQVNEQIYKELGQAGVCGKCLVGLPCTSTNPVV